MWDVFHCLDDLTCLWLLLLFLLKWFLNVAIWRWGAVNDNRVLHNLLHDIHFLLFQNRFITIAICNQSTNKIMSSNCFLNKLQHIKGRRRRSFMLLNMFVHFNVLFGETTHQTDTLNIMLQQNGAWALIDLLLKSGESARSQCHDMQNYGTNLK